MDWLDELVFRQNLSTRGQHLFRWKLERFIKRDEATFAYDVFPSEPQQSILADFKEDLIVHFNLRSMFDVDYVPQERDFFSLIYTQKHNDYLHLIYLNGEWVEEPYIDFYRSDMLDTYEEIASGHIELKNYPND